MSSGSLTSDTEYRKVDEPGAEAQDRSVGVEHPLILLDRRPQELDEVGVGHLAHPRLEEAADARRLALAEFRVGQGRHRVVDRLDRHRIPDRVVLPGPHRDTDGRAHRPGGPVDGRAQRRLEHLTSPVRPGAVEKLVADVAERYDVVGYDLGVDTGD